MKIPLDKRDEFVGYVLRWYNLEWVEILRPPPDFSEVEWATDLLLAHYADAAVQATHPLGCPVVLRFEGDSHDRELVRDMILVKRGTRQVEHAIVVSLVDNETKH